MFMFVLAQLVGCDDTVFPVVEEAVEGEGWCAVESIIEGSCISCHSSENRVAEPDLQTDPASIVDASSTGGLAFVVPGEPDQSFFYRKLADDLVAGEGGVMPPTGALGDGAIATVRTWIEDGAAIEADCAGGAVTPVAARFHAVGWADPDVHGPAAMLNTLSCDACHGADLTGGTGPSCDTRHGSPEASDAWRTDCTFCHGERGVTPSPPRQIDGSPDASTSSNPAHRMHTDIAVLARKMACATCHVYPESATSPGHMLDDTPGAAEVTMAQGTWNAEETSCTVSCHGPDPVLAASTVVCGDCHGIDSASSDRLGGEHHEHLAEGLACIDCHDSVDATATSITRLTLHVNGVLNYSLPAEVVRDANGCTGTCHGESHTNASW